MAPSGRVRFVCRGRSVRIARDRSWDDSDPSRTAADAAQQVRCYSSFLLSLPVFPTLSPPSCLPHPVSPILSPPPCLPHPVSPTLSPPPSQQVRWYTSNVNGAVPTSLLHRLVSADVDSKLTRLAGGDATLGNRLLALPLV
ncbi:unnamed protein product [Closterium sp. NIES-64]|nr:unnamed protein product [Closterium sp. NIES-64]